MLVTRPPIDRQWLEDELDELARLVDAGETLELVGEMSRIVSSPRREAGAESEAGAEATSASESV